MKYDCIYLSAQIAKGGRMGGNTGEDAFMKSTTISQIVFCEYSRRAIHLTIGVFMLKKSQKAAICPHETSLLEDDFS